MNLPVQLRLLPAAVAPPEAWFLGGTDAAHWLDELVRSGLATEATRLFFIPRSSADASLAGVLVVPGAGSATVPPAGLGLRRLSDRLFVPCDADLVPPLTDAEIREAVPFPVALLHPSFGLSGFEANAGTGVWELLEYPEERPGTWNAAVLPPPALAVLEAIQVLSPPAPEEIFGSAREDIGTQPTSTLPAASSEPADDLPARTWRRLLRQVADRLKRATDAVPRRASGRTWINSVEEWAEARLRRLDDELERLRHRELNRLLELLARDPDAGLRHAIPLHDFPARGVAPPGARLGSHDLKFDPAKLGGSPTDAWDVPPEIQATLRQRYRELAQYELQLGRYQRAAFIYAQLLGDLASAVGALKQGRYFREAAVLLNERLQRPAEAAACLAEGGLFSEALALYHQLERWLEAADLHERMGQLEAARAVLQLEVERRLQAEDRLGAARLLVERLREPDAALKLLADGWPASRQAVAGLEFTWELLAQTGRHRVAHEWLDRVRNEAWPATITGPLVGALAESARRYPETAFRQRATDLARVLIARRLNTGAASPSEVESLVGDLVRLAPGDRLISRDAQRFLANRRGEARRRNAIPPPLSAGGRPGLLLRFQLPSDARWLQMRSDGDWFFALGLAGRRLTVVRGVWHGEIQSLSWELPGEGIDHGYVFEPTWDRGRTIVLARPGAAPIPPKLFPRTDAVFVEESTAGLPSWLPASSLPLAFGEDTLWTIHLAAGRAVLSWHTKTGRLCGTVDATEELLAGAERSGTWLALAAPTQAAAVALGNRLVVYRPGGGGLKGYTLPGQVQRLVTAAPFEGGGGVAALMGCGAAVHWVGSNDVIEADSELPEPLGALLPGGSLILVAGRTGRTIAVSRAGVQSTVTFELVIRDPVAVCATADPNAFAVLGASGEVAVYRAGTA